MSIPERRFLLMIKKMIAQQFRRPSGFLGYFAARFMKNNNRDTIMHMCDLIDPQDDDAVLEIGCGAGYAIRLITGRNALCTVDAIDFSPLMVREAIKNNRTGVPSRRVNVICGDFGSHDFIGKTYTKIAAVNVIYFWNDPAEMFTKVNRLLKSGGSAYFYMSSPERLNAVPFAVDAVFHKRSIGEVKEMFVQAGFSGVRYETVNRQGSDGYFIIAEK
jgi:SAM-dependent methyltransferase